MTCTPTCRDELEALVVGTEGVTRVRGGVKSTLVFMLVDPLASEMPSYSPYVYGFNNPIGFTDPTGMAPDNVVVPNAEDRPKVLSDINSQAAGTFAFNKAGELYRVESGSPETGSTYLADRLVEAIESENTISIFVQPTVEVNGKTINVADRGEGLTLTVDGNPNADIVVSGKGTSDQMSVHGLPLDRSSGEILSHELVGHAIPKTVGTDTGNAIQNDNKVREQNGQIPRAADPAHKEEIRNN